MRTLQEVLEEIREIKTKLENGSITDKDEKRLDELLVEKADIEKRQNELRNKFDNSLEVPKPSGRKSEIDTDLKYRKQFREYVQGKRKKIDRDVYPEYVREIREQRATTTSSDIGEVIPSPIMNKIVEEMEDYGEIFALVTKTNYPAGVDIPTSSAKPSASWVAEGSVATGQSKSTGEVSFSYYKLQMRVELTLIASIVSLDMFEQSISKNIAEAMVLAIETAIVAGTGSGQPLGIAVDTNSDIKDTVLDQGDASYANWIQKAWSQVPKAYRKNKSLVWLMNQATFDTYVTALVDSNGQPVARTTMGLDGEPIQRFLGKRVIFSDDLDSLVDNAATTDVVHTILCPLSDYLFNTSMEIRVKRWFDDDTDKYVQKATLIADGKLMDGRGVVRVSTSAV